MNLRVLSYRINSSRSNVSCAEKKMNSLAARRQERIIFPAAILPKVRDSADSVQHESSCIPHEMYVCFEYVGINLPTVPESCCCSRQTKS